ncbi:DNA-directed RNA polymerase I subunit 1 [Neltuma alba]|uniref:DNA-directed RNA polymerase I subunit 1 n=1 Tax=Neltuma alba TaxID=207710 RepID=UPI0010A3BE87|nr:DNA-directed RNA polymerase I subunit 1-like [Prosopis alba]XP_028787417.1 DNA-directed RNA polymerase I subunit 1-like [Prosopis alba]
MAQIPECATESVEAVAFSFLTTEEIQKTSFVKITNPILVDGVERPVPGGLYDPALGPPDDRTLCKSCGQPSKLCPGHFGHIELVSPVYNPLLFNILSSILQRTCFSCHFFRASRDEVEKFTSQLELIVKGDIIGAKKLDSPEPSESTCLGDDDWIQSHSADHLPGKWNSHQFSEAMSILNNFLKREPKKCRRCGSHNPKISKPTFGWFYVSDLSSEKARGNVIRHYADEIISDVMPSENRDNSDEDMPSATSAGTINSASKQASSEKT